MQERPPGHFIVLEGSDGAGKKTQSELLQQTLHARGLTVELMSFPQYDTPFGALVGKYLRGEFGSRDEVPPEIPAMLFAMDRYQFRDEIEAGLRAGTWYLSDRYSQSNLGFQPARFTGEARWEFVRWIEILESRLPQPDFVIFLHVPIEISQRLIASRAEKGYLQGKCRDIYECDESFQRAVLATYLELAQENDDWVLVECVADGELLPIEAIHTRVVDAVERWFGWDHEPEGERSHRSHPHPHPHPHLNPDPDRDPDRDPDQNSNGTRA